MNTEASQARNAVRLMTWLSPSFPVGAYSYSHGLEFAVEDGRVTDRDSLTAWCAHLLRFGAGHTDAVLLRAAHDAVAAGRADAFAELAMWADAMRATPEMALESTAQGRAFVDTLTAVWPDLDLAPWLDVLAAAERPAAYATLVGAVAALADVPAESAIAGYLHAYAANIVSAGVRLVPLGQTDGQRTLAALEPLILEAAEEIAARPRIAVPDDLGSAAPLADWASVKHETQYTRLFRS